MKLFKRFILLVVLAGCIQQIACPARPRCKDSYKIAWMVHPPYLMSENGNVSGIIPSLIDNILEDCCQKKVNLTYHLRIDSRAEAVEQILNATTDLIFPVSGPIGKQTFFSFPYITVVESPGIAFYTRPLDSPKDAIFRAIKTTWPLLILIMLLVGINGVLFWLLEYKFNRDSCTSENQSQGSVTDGLFTGVWWAIVTMTTVGYGDVYAKSTGGRILTIIWLLLGVVACAIFTGIVTATLTSICLSNDVDLRGTNVAAFPDSEEYKLAVSRNAIPVVASSVEEMTRKMESNAVDGLLLDSYVAGQFQHLLHKHRLQNVFEKFFALGIVLGADTARHGACFHEYILSRQNKVYKAISYYARPLKTDEKSDAEKKSRGIIDITSKSVYLPVIIAFTLFIVLCFVGHLRDRKICRKETKNKRNRPSSCHQEYSLASLKTTHGSEIRRVMTELLSDTADLKHGCTKLIGHIEERMLTNSRGPKFDKESLC